ncbi:MAG: hypothetical protein MRZ60_03545, partial [Blautia sp.]|nr:hypothetical protein [Blautia sp.]
HAQAHGYWTGYPYEQAAERIANTGRLRQQSTFIIGDVCVSRHFRLRSAPPMGFAHPHTLI